jgi:hypothetical protein
MSSLALSNRKSRFIRLGSLAVLLASALVLASTQGCNQGREGDRCNPGLLAQSEDECGSGLVCTQPTDCPENYCCPPDGTSPNPFCQTGCNGGQAAICAAGGMADCPDGG